jgi:hypothetical protein
VDLAGGAVNQAAGLCGSLIRWAESVCSAGAA